MLVYLLLFFFLKLLIPLNDYTGATSSLFGMGKIIIPRFYFKACC